MMSTSILSIVLTVTGFIWYEYSTFRQILVNDLAAKADLIAQNSTAALVFVNKDDAQQTLKTLESQPRILAGGIYDRNNMLFAKYTHARSQTIIPLTPGADGYKFESNRLLLFQPINLSDGRIGTIYLESDLKALYDRFASLGTITILVLLGSSLAAFALATALQNRVSQPILRLAETARTISERRDYTVRAEKTSRDELGLLAEAFNQMLTQIQDRDTNLRGANETMAREIAERERAEEIMRASEERKDAILRSALDAIMTIDHKGNIVEFNPAAEKMFGFTRAEVMGKEMAELIIPQHLRGQHRRGLEHYLATGKGPVLGKLIEMIAMRIDGSEFPIELSIMRVGMGTPPIFTGFIRDITERKQEEAVLRASEERFRQLFQTHPLPMWVYDLKTLQFLEVNESAVKIYGYSRDEFLSMRITEIRPAEDIPRLLENLKGGRPSLEISGPWRHRLKNGRTIDVEVVSHQTEFMGREAVLVVSLDVTERRRAEQELKISEERYRSLVSAITSIVWTVDPEGKFIVPQKSWEKYTGQSWEEHAGLGWLSALHPEDRNSVERIWEEVRSIRKASEFDGRIWHAASRAYRYFVARAVPLVNPDGSVREWIGTITDVHDRKLAEEEIRHLNEELEERVKRRTSELESANKELEAFSYSVSHDLRGPLRHIDGFAEMLLKKTKDSVDERVTRYSQVISESAKNMGRLIDELLVFSRMGRTEMQNKKVVMKLMVDGVITDLQHEIVGRTIQWNVKQLPEVTGDPEMLKLVIVNLISNAVKYTSKREIR
ncbi:MAG: PAS domain S-box protein [Ignavibacteria bacterium]|nr:PAS domain S-box protein [Ignavibacteria bacterium]